MKSRSLKIDMPSIIDIPSEIVEKWQEIVDFLADMVHVPAALVVKHEHPNVRVLVSSASQENPFEADQYASLDGLYCEAVMNTRQPLLVPDASDDEEWKFNPNVKLGMISYFGLPLFWPDGKIFGTVCVLDNKKNLYDDLYRKSVTQCRDVIQADLARVAKVAAEITKQREHLDQLFTRVPEAIALVGPNAEVQRFNPELTKIIGSTEEEALSLANLLGSGNLQAEIAEDRPRVGLKREVFSRETVRQGRHGRIPGGSVAVPVGPTRTSSCASAIYRDITERERLENVSRCEQDRLRLLLEIARLITSKLGLHALIEALSTDLLSAMRCDYCALLLPDPDGIQLRATVLFNPAGRESVYEGMIVPTEGSISGKAFRAEKIARVNSFESVRRDAEVYGNCLGQRFCTRLLEEGLQSGSYIPLLSQDRALGVLAVLTRSENVLDEEEAKFHELVAHYIAAAVENALLDEKATEYRYEETKQTRYLPEEVTSRRNFEEIGDGGLKTVLDLVEVAAASDSRVLILGEVGAIRELIARAIHDLSSRRERAFVKINCAAISMGVLESEIFGREKEAVAGAILQKLGSLDLADKGTLFLDEVGDLPLKLQEKVLRLLQEQEFERQGGNRTSRVDVRIIAATRHDLAAMVKEKAFCEDLYDRLKVFSIHMPAMLDRASDIPQLVWRSVSPPARRMKMRSRLGGAAMLNADPSETNDETPVQLSLHKSTEQQVRPIRLLIVDSQPVYREGLRTILESQSDMLVLGRVATATEAVAEFRRHRPDVTLLSQRVNGLPKSDTDALITIRAEFPSALIIILTTADGDAEIQRALRAGAASYVLKDAPAKELLDIIRSVYRGRKHIPPAVAARLAEHPGSEDLTPRELDVLKLIRDGNKNKQIADKLSISQTTVNFHIRNIVDKLQANDRVHAVTVALRRGHLHLNEA